ncbi:MAG: cytidylate kinase-like family protein [Polyangiaceae bacterium]|nr:cytidylate kinase-like family protein [Polyangiaceae bacterium]
MARSIQQLIELNLRRVELQSTPPPPPRRERGLDQKPMITISREFGGRGAELGRRIAQKLGFQYHSQELVHEVAKQAKVRKQLVESLDERARDAVEQWVTELFDGESFAPNEYLRNLSKVIGTLGRQGRGVIIGRGAQFILDPRRTLRIRAFAPLEHRVALVAKRRGLGPGEARALVQRVDSERQAFYSQHFDVNVSDSVHYDVLLNTATLGIGACSDVVLRAYRARFAKAR